MDTKPKPFIFVLMPFSKEFRDLYNLGIKKACEDAGAYCERVDEQIFQGSVLNRVYNQISKSDTIISVMTDLNPNVFYETGYAHALGKTTILLTDKAESIPFDLKHSPHIIYNDSITNLIPELRKQLIFYLQRSQSEEKYQPPFVVQIEETELEFLPFSSEYGTNIIKINNKSAKTEPISVDIHINIQNSVAAGLLKRRIRLGCFCENYCRIRNSVRELEGASDYDGLVFNVLSDDKELFPGEWYMADITLGVRETINTLQFRKNYTLILRILTESSYYDYPFRIRLTTE